MRSFYGEGIKLFDFFLLGVYNRKMQVLAIKIDAWESKILGMSIDREEKNHEEVFRVDYR